jgi:hypothetical protein
LNEYITSDVDLTNNNRIAHGTVDMGAYELPWYVIVATNQGPGTIDPCAIIDVPQGSNILFVATPDEHYQFSGFKTNGNLVASESSTFEWQNISSSGTILAIFSDIMITNGMSEIWLAESYPNRNNYNTLANIDTDGDGLVAWQEFVALTDPNDEESVFKTFITTSSNEITVSWLPFDDSLRTYSVEASTNILTPLNTISNKLRNGSITFSTDTFFKYFRINVQE